MRVAAAENRKLLHEQEVERALITLLALDDAHVQMAAAHALGVLAENLVCRDAIGTWGVYLAAGFMIAMVAT